MFIAARGAIALIVQRAFGQSPPHFPLYLAEALCVELAALFLARRTLALGAASGLLIGTVGFAAEWGWSLIAMPIPWSSDLFPEGLILATVSAVAGGLVGALMACALRGELPSARLTRAIPAACPRRDPRRVRRRALDDDATECPGARPPPSGPAESA
jgi:hypothetical protein